MRSLPRILYRPRRAARPLTASSATLGLRTGGTPTPREGSRARLTATDPGEMRSAPWGLRLIGRQWCSSPEGAGLLRSQCGPPLFRCAARSGNEAIRRTLLRAAFFLCGSLGGLQPKVQKGAEVQTSCELNMLDDTGKVVHQQRTQWLFSLLVLCPF